MSRPVLRKVPLLAFAVFLSAPVTWAQAAYVPPVTDRAKSQLSGSWKFIASNTLLGAEAINFDDSSWSTVTVPHTWDSPSSINMFSNSWYRTHFAIPGATGKRIYIYFEGAYQVADVYVNGQHLGQHRGGYTRFIFDATAAINFNGDNVLAVMVSSTNNCTDCLPDGGTRLFHPYGGIYRKAWIVTANLYHVATTDFASSGVYVTPANVSQSSSNLSIKTMVTNDNSVAQTFTVENVLTDSGGSVVLHLSQDILVAANSTSNVTQTGVVANPFLWSKNNPYLYSVFTNVKVNGVVTDSVAEHTGFRFYQLTASFFTLNGVVTRLRGISKHEESEYHATALTDQELMDDWNNIQDVGANYVRLAHNPHAQLEYDLADQKGIMVWCENGHTNSGPPTPNGNYINQEMVFQNWNHPSIIFWSAGNEADTTTASAYGAVIRAADASRPVVYASQGNAVTLANIDFSFSNIYPGWYYGSLYDFTTAVDQYHWISESGAGGVITTQNSNAFNTSFTVNSYEPEQYMQMVNELKFQTMFVSKPDAIPVFSNWVFRDFGDPRYKSFINSKGFLTFSNYRKDIFYLYKSELVTLPVVHIVGPHYFVRDGSGAIKVYSNAAKISLTVNGTLVGAKSNGQYAHPNGMVIGNVFYWDAVLQNGRNVVQASDGLGNSDVAVIYFTGTGIAAPPDSGALASNLTSSNGVNPAYFINAPVQNQWGFYYDFNSQGDNTFDVVPSPLVGANWIATKRQSDPTQTTNLSFSLNANADVYVMFTRQSSVPLWIADNFSDTGVTGMWRDNNLQLVNYQLYKTSCSAGANASIGSSSIDFVVLVQPGAGGACKIASHQDFSLSATPSSQTITVGSPATFIQTVTAVNGFTGVVALSVSGLPTGATSTFNPTSIAGGSGSAKLNVSTSCTTPTGTYPLTITSTSGRLTHTTGVTLMVSTSVGLPAGWTDTDIGKPGCTGSASFTTGAFKVNGGGADIWGSSDSFNYLSEFVSGAVILTARVAAQQNTDAWAKAGVMIRETTAPNSAYALLTITPANGVSMQYRPSTGASAIDLIKVAGPIAPYWVRLARSGNTFTGFGSPDGVSWTQLGTINFSIVSGLTGGLAVTAHNNSVLNASVFDNVNISAAPVTTPTFSPAAGTYLGTQTVTLSDATSGATIFYTFDGTQPGTSAAGSTLQYSGPLTVTSTRTIKALATAVGQPASATASATYTIQSQAATPSFSPTGGTYTSAQSVNISTTTPSSTIYYTTDGTMPTHASAVYIGPLTVSVSETLKAIATATGFLDSNVTAAIYTISSPGTVATPTFSPPAGTYVGTQTVTLSDATSGGTIFYTLDGTQPGIAAGGSTLPYSGPLTVTSTKTIKALATATGQTTSATASATYTINSSGGTGTVSFASGFSTNSLVLNGNSAISGTSLVLTTNNPAFQASGAWFPTPVNIQAFTTDFSFKDPAGTPTADGLTFTLQGNSTTALGGSGGNLGYGGLGKSLAVKFDLFSNAGEGVDSTGLYLNGASPTTPAVDMTGSGIDLHSGDVFNVHMNYDGTNLTMTITDATTKATFSKSWVVDIPGTVGATTAYAGFTGSTEATTAIQQILNWTMTSITPTKATVQYETESATVFNASKSSGPTYRVFAWPGFTDGQGTTLDGTAAGQSVSITLNVPIAGVYDVKFASKAYATRGIVQLTVNGANVGPAEDLYATSEVWKLFDQGNITLPAGNVAFVFTSIGKNAASSAFTQAFDYINLAQQ